MPKLHILSGLLEGKTVELIEERITIGRALDNNIRLEDGTVSSHHAILTLEDTDYKVRDLNSTNGTRVNGIRIVETTLRHGDILRLGSVEMRYESEAKKQSQPLPPVQRGVDLNQLGAGSAPPPTFGSASPFGRKKHNQTGWWLWVIIGLGLVVVVVLGLLIARLLKFG